MGGTRFDKAAPGWDTERRAARAHAVALQMRAAIPPGGSGMEYGCGTGLVGLSLSDHFSSLLLMDASPGMIEAARGKLGQPQYAHVRACVGDLMAGYRPAECYDAIIHAMVLHHIRDTAGALAALHALLSPGGTLCFADIDEEDGSFHADDPAFDGHNGFRQPALRALMREQMFVNVRSHTFYRDIRMAAGREAPYSLFLMTGSKA